MSGAVNYGSRAPLASVPVWATPEVVTGGFVTGKLLAGGPLQDHEQKLCDTIPTLAEHRERRVINAYYLTDAGLAGLQKLKNSAYASRQMIFYLSLLSEAEQREFVTRTDQHLQEQNEQFHIRFRPALNGLALTVSGGSIDRESVWNPTVRRFLGWSKSRHWLAPAAA